MKALAVFFALVATLAAALPGMTQQPHWLVGTWEGEVRGLGNNPTGTKRSIVVNRVAADGASAQAIWNTESTSGPITILINGETITFKPGGGNDYTLARKGNVLEGSWTSNVGRSGGITLTRK
jgi:hypothetical protein